MRKILCLALAVVMVFSMTIMASAENTTTLTTTVPDAEYTLHIPADTVVKYGEERTDIGNITVTGSSGFALGKNLEVTVTYEPFSCANVSTTIPFILVYSSNETTTNVGSAYPQKVSGSAFTFLGQADDSVQEKAITETPSSSNRVNMLGIKISSEDWGKALAGDYTAVITFSAKVVAE